jgi:hypothetical protein
MWLTATSVVASIFILTLHHNDTVLPISGPVKDVVFKECNKYISQLRYIFIDTLPRFIGALGSMHREDESGQAESGESFETATCAVHMDERFIHVGSGKNTCFFTPKTT